MSTIIRRGNDNDDFDEGDEGSATALVIYSRYKPKKYNLSPTSKNSSRF